MYKNTMCKKTHTHTYKHTPITSITCLVTGRESFVEMPPSTSKPDIYHPGQQGCIIITDTIISAFTLIIPILGIY